MIDDWPNESARVRECERARVREGEPPSLKLRRPKEGEKARGREGEPPSLKLRRPKEGEKV